MRVRARSMRTGGMRARERRTSGLFGLWSVLFPLVLVRTGRRLPVQALGERGVLVSVIPRSRRDLFKDQSFANISGDPFPGAPPRG